MSVNYGDQLVKKVCFKHNYYVVVYGQFLPIIVSDNVCNSLNDLLMTAFYSFVLKMIDFWDRVYFEKIEAIYNSDYDFSKEELKELAYEYQTSMHKVKTNRKRNNFYLAFYLLTCTIVSWTTIFYYGSTKHGQ